MAKIKVSELRELHKVLKKDIQTHEFNGLPIEISSYLPIKEKISLVSSIYESAVNRNDGLHIVNYNSLNIAFKIFFISTYSNITLPKDEIESYDLISESGLFDFVYDKLPMSERIELKQVLGDFIQSKEDIYEQENTIQYTIKELFNGLINKLPSLDEAKLFVEQASKEFEGFDPNKLNFVKDFLHWNGGDDSGDNQYK